MTTEKFQLDARLQQDTIHLRSWPLCEVLLMNDSQYPWVILVPRRSGVRELYQLSADDQQQFWRESMALGECLMSVFAGDKLNIAALGNIVSQLHVHHVVRFETDPAWPAPVWGKHPARHYGAQELEAVKNHLQALDTLLGV
jgi:diadenosine tetraphosphate (Ap4A) HIT family hydrolase